MENVEEIQPLLPVVEEGRYLEHRKDSDHPDLRGRNFNFSYTLPIFALIVISIFTVNLYHVSPIVSIDVYPLSSYQSPNSPISQTQIMQTGVHFTVTNKYVERDGAPGKAYPWLKGKHVAEPYVDTTLRVTEGLNEFLTYKWEIDDGDVSFYFEGRAIHFTFFPRKEAYKVRVKKMSLEGKVMGEREGDVEVRYVRREIRSLFDEDREDFLDTMVKLWEIETKDGQKLYGPDYLSVHDLLKIHLLSTGQRNCDFMHGGFGFLTQHTALSYLFEKSIQSINPKFSLPYWDYTQDMEYFQRERDSDFTKFHEIELLTDKFFGETDIEQHRIKSGRWAHFTIPYMTQADYDHFLPHNGFGLLRSPWNLNKSPHITRAFDLCGSNPADTFQMSDCSAFHGLFKKDKWSDFAHMVPFAPHGPVHIALGGTLHCKEAYDELEDVFPTEIVTTMRGYSFIAHRNLFLKKILECPTDGCDAAAAQQTCKCTCPKLESLTETTEGLEKVIRQSRIDRGVPNIMDFKKTSLHRYLQVVCNSGMINGESLQSSSPMTPEFWLVHPNLERLFQWKKIADPFITEDAADTFYEDDKCMGQKADDYVLQGTYKNKDHGGITNKDLHAMMDPHRKTVLSYIYDKFEWNHCKEYGYNF